MFFNLFYSNLIISPELVETLIVPTPKVVLRTFILLVLWCLAVVLDCQ